MKLIVEQCHKIKHHFIQTLTQHPIEAALLLGNLLLLEKSATLYNKKLIFETLDFLKQLMTRKEVTKLWDAITEKLAEIELSDDKTKKALKRVQSMMVSDIDFITKLPFTKIVFYGQDINCYRRAMIALIRRHLYFEGSDTDPFAGKFNMDLVLSASVEQNYLYLSVFLKLCPTLPCASLISLGNSHVEIANLLLKDLYNTEPYFEISLAFMRKYPNLRRDISLQWKLLLENYPVQERNSAKLKEYVRQARIYPEFSDVQLEGRVVRSHQAVEIAASTLPISTLIKCLGLSGAVILLPRVMNHIAQIGTLSAAMWYGSGVYPAAVGVCTSALGVGVPAAAIGTLTWLASRAMSQNKRQCPSDVAAPIAGTKSRIARSIN